MKIVEGPCCPLCWTSTECIFLPLELTAQTGKTDLQRRSGVHIHGLQNTWQISPLLVDRVKHKRRTRRFSESEIRLRSDKKHGIDSGGKKTLNKGS